MFAFAKKGKLDQQTLSKWKSSDRYDTYLRPVLLVICGSIALLSHSFAADGPKLVQKDGRYALMVDGRPYLILGGQIHNSSAWPIELPQVWESITALHANTVEAPVYWEPLEPREGRFDFDNVDQIVGGARSRNLRVVLLWFGTCFVSVLTHAGT